jgi:hypothetical protein
MADEAVTAETSQGLRQFLDLIGLHGCVCPYRWRGGQWVRWSTDPACSVFHSEM